MEDKLEHDEQLYLDFDFKGNMPKNTGTIIKETYSSLKSDKDKNGFEMVIAVARIVRSALPAPDSFIEDTTKGE